MAQAKITRCMQCGRSTDPGGMMQNTNYCWDCATEILNQRENVQQQQHTPYGKTADAGDEWINSQESRPSLPYRQTRGGPGGGSGAANPGTMEDQEVIKTSFRATPGGPSQEGMGSPYDDVVYSESDLEDDEKDSKTDANDETVCICIYIGVSSNLRRVFATYLYHI